MALKRLKLQHCRNLQCLDVQFNTPGFNIVIGKNGSGKTSLLEAIQVLSSGRSFRTADLSQIITNNCIECSLYGELAPSKFTANTQLGFSKNRTGITKAKLDGKTAKASDLAKTLPIRSINPIESSELVNAGPRGRREFIDWGVFHVKHSYSTVLKNFNRVLKQRNMALKMHCSNEELLQWNQQFSKLSGVINQERQNHLKLWLQHFKKLTNHITLFDQLSFEYQQGWPLESNLEQLLEQEQGKERALGYSLYGPQRADLMIKINSHPAKEQLSRGQQKLCAVAMYLAQGEMINTTHGRHPIYLIDDFSSELDEISQDLLLSVLNGEETQVILTALTLDQSLAKLKHQDNTSIFSLEDGKLCLY